ncbi:tetratricopeptide repeat protein 16-like [Seriola aureovittata]|uniref:tetratricopeptide repeat protein 16-like n=1 Tax=Seriola aureovittata TaxID=2871759 RepID=UPI0024BDA695|nr:tetratricopeptide repeat protein 16-like [Seriola aureovittata]
METSVERKDQTAEEQSLFPTAVSEEELDEARRKSSFKQLFGSSKIFLAPGEKRPYRPDLQGSLIIQSRAAEHYTNGKEAMGKFQYEKAVICFSRAITLQPEQTQLYVSQAEAYLQLCDFQSAAACYKKAWLLEPGAFRDRLAFIYYLQGQCLFDRRLFLEALEAFTKAAEVKPGCRVYAVRSLACLTAAGHLTDCLQLVNDWMVSDGPTSDLYILRARLHQQLHQVSQCYRDVTSALALNPSCPAAGALLQQLQRAGEQARQKSVDRAVSGELPEALCMINIALENCPRDARLYLFRGILYRRLKDFTAAIEDLIQAVELNDGGEGEERGEAEKGVKGQAEAARDKRDERGSFEEQVEFQLVLTYNDFAVQCFSRAQYAEATLLLNKAIEEEKSQAGLYLNRGDCFFKQGDWCYALVDYQQAEEMMRPGDPAVRLRLAVLHNTLGSFCFQDCFFKQGDWCYALVDYQQAEEMMRPGDPAVRLRLAVLHNTLGSFCFQGGHFQEAADMFSLAVQYDPSAAQYYEKRSKAFRKLQNLKGARQDLICVLILDPTNEELPPMLMSLFPGCSVSDVLSSPGGQAVRDQLMDTIQTCTSCSEPQRLSEKLQQMTLTNQSTASQSEAPPEAGEELKLCMNQQEMEIMVKSLLQVPSRPQE